MNKEIKDWLESEEGKAYIEGLITPDRVKTFLDTDEGKKVIQPSIDKNFAKGLETWKANNLTKIIEDEIAKKFPEETEEKKELRKLRDEIASERKARLRETLRNKALSEATQKNLPVEIVDYFVGEDDDTTKSNLIRFEETWHNAIKNAVEGKFKEGGRTPAKTEPDPQGYSREQLMKMSPEEINANWDAIEKRLSKK